FPDTIHFTSTDKQPGLPADYTFTPADKGSHTFTITLGTLGSQAVYVSDATRPTVALTGAATYVTPGVAASFLVTGFPPADGSAGANNSGVTAVDAYGNQAPGSLGTVHFPSSDPTAILPADYPSTAADNGKHSFVVTLNGLGNQSLTVTDAVNGLSG